MNELAGLHPQISELSEYEQYLLSALLKKAAADAGRTLNISERRAVAAEFSLETCPSTTLNGR